MVLRFSSFMVRMLAYARLGALRSSTVVSLVIFQLVVQYRYHYFFYSYVDLRLVALILTLWAHAEARANKITITVNTSSISRLGSGWASAYVLFYRVKLLKVLIVVPLGSKQYVL